MDYLGLIAFCIGFGWIPLFIIGAPIFLLIDNLRNKR